MRKLLLSCFIAAAAFTSAKAQLQHRHVTPMDSLRTSSADLSNGNDTTSYFGIGDTVTVEGIVTFNPGYYGLSTNRKGSWLQAQSSDGKWSAIHVLIDASRLKALTGINTTLAQLNSDVKFYENFVPGLKVKVTGLVDDYQGYTQLVLLPIESEITDLTPNRAAPREMDISTFSKSDGSGGQVMQLETGEPYESVYAEFRDVTIVDVTSGSGNRYFWSIQDKNGNKLQVRDASGFFRNDKNADSLQVNTFMPIEQSKVKYIRGVIFQSSVAGVNMYSIAPLMASDLDLIKAPIINSVSRKPSLVKSNDVVTITAYITDDENDITAAKLYYSVGMNNTTYTTVNMTEASSNYFTAQIPAQANGSMVNYFIKATNTPGLSGFSPDSFVTGHHYIVKNEGITKISDLQYDPLKTGASIWNGDTLKNLNLKAVVTASVGQKDLGFLVIQDGTAPFSGIMIKGNTDVASENIKRGDSVVITSAAVREDFNVTILEDVKLNVLTSNGTIPAAIKNVSIDSITAGKYNYAEAYESMLLEYNDAYVVNLNADASTNGKFGEWVIDTDMNDATGLRVDDISNDILPKNTFALDSFTLNQKLDYIRGILTYSFSNWKLLPRNKDDIAGFKTETVGMKNAAEKVSFRLYPNPANNTIYIQSQKSFSNATLQLVDLQGKVFLEQAIYGNSPKVQLSGSSLPNGLYLLKISDKSSVQVQKVFIQR